MRLALDVQYKKVPLMYIADGLIRTYMETTENARTELCEIRALDSADHEEHILVDPPKRDVFREQVAADPDVQELIRIIKQGWSDKRKCCFPLL